jgi:large subunit ribosomal protein L1
MTQHSKAYRAVADKIDKDALYTPLQATTLAKESGSKTYDSTVDVSMRLGVDPRNADQMVRGTVNLPHGTGKTARVLVFATGANADAAREAGADHVGSDDLVEKVNEGWLDFDAVVATPDMMGKVGRLGRVLGPRNLMPNPKTGTVTTDVAKAVSDIKGGAALEEILRLKPASSKGRYVKKVTISTTQGPGVPVDPSHTKGFADQDDN